MAPESPKIELMGPFKKLLLCWGCLVIVFWPVHALSRYRAGDNLGDVIVKRADQSGAVAPGLQILALSTWGSVTILIPGKPGTWVLPPGNRIIKEIRVKQPGGIERVDEHWLVSLTTPAKPKWFPAVVEKTISGEAKLKLATERPGSLLPGMRQVINWRGDGRLFWLSGISSLYTVTAVLGLLALGWKFRARCKNAITEIWHDLRPRPMECCVYLALLIAFAVLNFRNCGLGTVMFRFFDELSLIREMQSWLAAPFTNSAGLYYGFSFNIAALPFVAPGLAVGSFDVAVAGARMFTAVGMIASLHVFWRTMQRFVGGKAAIGLGVFLCCVPYFWIMGTFFHPDAMMAALLLGCFYYLLTDELQLGKQFLFACAFFGAASAVKLHALIYAPLLPLFVCAAFASQRSRAVLRPALIGAAVSVTVFLLLEPRLLSWAYVGDYWDGFWYQMRTNKAWGGLSSDFHVQFRAKLSTVGILYSHPVIITSWFAIAVFSVIRAPAKWAIQFAALLLSFIIVAVYYSWYLSKNLDYYYLPVLLVLYFLGGVALGRLFPKRYRLVVILVLLLAQCVGAWGGFKNVVDDCYMPPVEEVVYQKDLDSHLQTIAQGVDKDAVFLMCYRLAFNYLKAGLRHDSIRYLYTETISAVRDGDFSAFEAPEIKVIVLNKRYDNRDLNVPALKAELLRWHYLNVYESPLALVLQRPDQPAGTNLNSR